MRLTQKGQVTVPKKFRQRYGLKRGCEVEFEAADGGVLIRPARASKAQELAEGIAAVRGSASKDLSTAEIMKLTRG